MRKPSKTNAILLSIIGVMIIGFVTRFDTGSLAAWAQPAQTDPPFNAAEQRKQMILALQQLNTRLQAIEGKLGGTVSVKVIEMPPVIIKEPAAKK